MTSKLSRSSANRYSTSNGEHHFNKKKFKREDDKRTSDKCLIDYT